MMATNRSCLPQAAGIFFTFISVFFLAGEAPAAINTPSPKIISFSPKTGQPFTLVTVKGSNFNPSSTVSVTFSDGLQYLVLAPVISATTTTLLISLPPYFTAGGAWAAHRVSIKINEKITGKPLISSNTLSGLEIQAPPTSSMPAGSYMLTMLQATLLADTNLQTKLIGTAVGTPGVQTALKSQIKSLRSLIAQVQSVVDGSSTGFVIATQNNSNVVVNAAALASTDRLVLSLLRVLATSQPPSLGLAAKPTFVSVTNPANGPNAVQAAARAALNATGIPELNAAMAQVVISVEPFVIAHPEALGYSLIFVGAALGAPELLAAAAPVARTLLLAQSIQWFIGTSDLFATVSWYSFESLSYAIPAVLSAGCAALNGRKAGFVNVVETFVDKLFSLLILKGDYVSNASGVFTVIDLYKCVTSFRATPDVGLYSGRCTGATSPVTCCSGDDCTTVSGATSASPPISLRITQPSTVLHQLCPTLTTALRGAGCVAAGCTLQGEDTSSFTLFASCTTPKVSGCTAVIASEYCGFKLK